MPSPLENLSSYRNKGGYEGMLGIDGRLVNDLIAACRTVAEKVDALQPILSSN